MAPGLRHRRAERPPPGEATRSLRRRGGFAVEERDDFSVDRLRWIIRLRWFALSTILIAALASIAGFFPGVNWRVLLATVAVAGVYNVVLWLRHRARRVIAVDRHHRLDVHRHQPDATDRGLLAEVGPAGRAAALGAIRCSSRSA